MGYKYFNNKYILTTELYAYTTLTFLATNLTHYTTTNSMLTLLNAKVDDSQVLTNVPLNALFTDTIYSKPSNEPISYITGLLAALNLKVDDSQVLTNVPLNALFTDTIYSKPSNEPISYITGLSTALFLKVDDSQVLTNVPAGALFTDTIYSKPANEPISYITGLQAALNAGGLIIQSGGTTQTLTTLNFGSHITNLSGGVLTVSRLTQYDKIPLRDAGISTIRDLESDLTGKLRWDNDVIITIHL